MTSPAWWSGFEAGEARRVCVWSRWAKRITRRTHHKLQFVCTFTTGHVSEMRSINVLRGSTHCTQRLFEFLVLHMGWQRKSQQLHNGKSTWQLSAGASKLLAGASWCGMNGLCEYDLISRSLKRHSAGSDSGVPPLPYSPNNCQQLKQKKRNNNLQITTR